MSRFRWSFQPNIACGAQPKLWSTVRWNFNAAIWWPRAIFHIDSMPAWCQLWTTWLWAFGYIRFTTSRRKSHVFCVSEKQHDRCRKRERFLVLTSAHHVELCGKTQIACIEANRVARKSHRTWPSGIRATGLICRPGYVDRQNLTYVAYKCSRSVGLQYLSCYTIMMQ